MPDYTSIVEIEQGKLKGQSRKSVNEVEFYSFKGIPYAKPPIGDLRFRVPEPPESWDGVRDATIKCNTAPQYNLSSDLYAGDEDCLFLNVYTPALPSQNADLRPVMFFIHGGGFVYSNGTEESIHGPEYLIEKGVVVVSINYRLGILGFLSLDIKEAPGNMGLRDQVQALKWVQTNIAQFGGDPNNVTIFGISAGAASVEYLLLSKTAKGLFHKAIAQAGSSLAPWAQNNKTMSKLASSIPLMNGDNIEDIDLLEYLKSLPVKDLIISSMKALAADKFKGGIHFGFVPVIEKPIDWEPFLDKSTYEMLSNGDFNTVPLISGICSREGLVMIPLGAPLLHDLVLEKNFLKHVPLDIDDDKKDEVESKLKAVYLEGENAYSDDDFYATAFFSDVFMVGGCYIAAKLIAKNNNDNPVYFYEFTYDGGFNSVKRMLNIKRKGACHADDKGYVFKGAEDTQNPSESDKSVRDGVTQMWANFAFYGNPTPEANNDTTKWDPMNDNDDNCLLIDHELTLKKDIFPERTRLWKELYEQFYKE